MGSSILIVGLVFLIADGRMIPFFAQSSASVSAMMVPFD
jgi:hypothetical protein